jgi:ribosomal protein L44E
MKIPKITNRYCPKCKKATEHKIEMYKVAGKRGSLSKGSIGRAKKRGLGTGHGNLGKWGSKPAISKWKRTGAKSSKKSALKYTCKECKKSTQQKSGFRAKKFEFN